MPKSRAAVPHEHFGVVLRLIKKNSSGREVKDVQNRLIAAGFLHVECGEIEEGNFGEMTDSAVRAFQQRRGLIADGIVGPNTWKSLVEASRSLGGRFLYLREPPFRGDDVLGLQRRLNGLGFYSGKEDGIFSSDTATAVEQFQRNAGLSPDGIVGTKTVDALLKLSRVTKPTGVAAIRELEKGLPSGGIEGRRIMLDPGHGYPPDPGEIGRSGTRESDVAERLVELLGRLLVERNVVVLYSRRAGEYLSESKRASRANQNEVDLLLSIHMNAATQTEASGASSYYFASGNYHSPYGYRFAHHLQDELVARLKIKDCRAHGAAVPLLRETRMPAIIIEPAFITNPEAEALLSDEEYLQRIAEGICEATCKYFLGVKSTAER